MKKDYSNKNLQKVSFKKENLSNAIFANSDLRGADFTGANLLRADFTHVKTGITPRNTLLIFLAAMVVSLLSGYVAMLGGHTVQMMLASDDKNVHYTGMATIIFIVFFILFCWWKGVKNAIKNLILPACALAVVIGLISYVSGFGTGKGTLYLMLTFVLVGAMFIVGTIARAAAGSLSNILFLIVALSGGMFGKSIGGGLGAVIVALACAQISKRALSGAKGFDGLRSIATFITTRFGTSFRDSKLTKSNFSGANVHNADFTNAQILDVNWADAKRKNCVTGYFKSDEV